MSTYGVPLVEQNIPAGFAVVYDNPIPTAVAGNHITNASLAQPIVITTFAAHGLTTGQLVNITGVLGTTVANGNWQITKVDASNFSLNGSNGIGAGAYAGAGTVTSAALYGARLVASS